MQQSIEHELLSVVDEHDRVLEQRTRGEIHRLGLRHRVVHVLIFDPDSRIYLQQRSKHKDVNPGFWDSSAAGHVDACETYDQCVVRELKEELGIELRKPPRKLFKLAPQARTGMEFCQVYKLDHRGPFELNREESLQGRWYSSQEIDDWVVRPTRLTKTFCVIWQALLRNNHA